MKTTRKPKSAREKLIDTAERLFNASGFHATGIDKIIAEAGVSKMTLYNHFKSKDELILATMRRADEEHRYLIIRAVEKRSKDPADRLLTLFDVLGDWFESAEFAGCLFINATAEYADPGDPIHRTATEHKNMLRRYFREQAANAGVNNPDALASQIALLMDGAIVTAQFTHNNNAAAQAKSAAKLILDQALDSDSSVPDK